jgi:hypothetical protein
VIEPTALLKDKNSSNAVRLRPFIKDTLADGRTDAPPTRPVYDERSCHMATGVRKSSSLVVNQSTVKGEYT